LFANTLGNLCEGTGSNVFVELDGRLVTPPLSSGCLAGVTRELLLEILDIGEVDVPIEHLGHTEEAFITSSTRDVLAVAHVDGEQLPLTNGPLTKEAAESFASLKASNVDP
ncbi:MAG: aminotransferase class IV, partial [Acidimicrobiia bacterium]|nr:aminotransferase class IV [Acidimicrobiia bacterium]